MATERAAPFFLSRDQDRFNEPKDIGIGLLSFKVTGAESQGGLFIGELVHHAPGGPPRHIHPYQDEWFSVLEGHYRIVVGDQLFELEPGDSVYGPRGVVHTWAHIGDETGRMMFVISPSGKMEGFLSALGRAKQLAPQEPTFWQRYDLELAGPPILSTP